MSISSDDGARSTKKKKKRLYFFTFIFLVFSAPAGQKRVCKLCLVLSSNLSASNLSA